MPDETVTRTRRIPALLAATAIAAAALVAGVATPALAAGPASVTVVPETTGEDPLTRFDVVCPTGSVTGNLTLDGLYNGAPRLPLTIAVPLDGTSEGSSGTYYLESFFDRGSVVSVSVACTDAGSFVLETSPTVTHTVFDSGATSSTPATLATNSSLIVTGDCGSVASIIDVTFELWSPPSAGAPFSSPTFTYTGGAPFSIDLGTPTSLGLAVGDDLLVQARCRTNAPTVHFTSLRSSTTTITAAAVVVPPVVPTVTAPAALASAGSEGVVGIAGVGAAVVLGGVALVLVRRRRARA